MKIKNVIIIKFDVCVKKIKKFLKNIINIIFFVLYKYNFLNIRFSNNINILQYAILKLSKMFYIQFIIL